MVVDVANQSPINILYPSGDGEQKVLERGSLDQKDHQVAIRWLFANDLGV